jgi:molybdopterin-guanine dinucleotide biosynthesis protein A
LGSALIAGDALPVVAVLLAGGRATRMGGIEKHQLRLGGETLLARQIRILTLQAERLVLSANGDPERFRDYGLPVIADAGPDVAGPDFTGPLAGLLAGMEWAREHRTKIGPENEWIVTVPTDLPFIPADLVGKLYHAVRRDGASTACAASGGRLHFATAIWATDLRERLRETLAQGRNKTEDIFRSVSHSIVDWPINRSVDPPLDPFLNINTPADFAAAQALDFRRES